MKVKELLIDERLKAKLFEDGIEELYPPQAEAIQKGILNHKNAVIAIPTASGKTLIAILAVFSTLIKKPGSKAVYLAPLRALASEKFQEFRNYASALHFRVAISTGDLDDNTDRLKTADIIIATNEKFDSLVRHQVEWLNEIEIIISDEIHLINDSSRGPVLEIVLSLIKRNLPKCQIIALSATIINADEIAEWLEATLILSEWRPVKLKEGVWFDGKITYGDGSIKEIEGKSDSTGFISLTKDVIKEGGQALVFANTRRTAMSSADALSLKLSEVISHDDQTRLFKIANTLRTTGEKTQLRERLANCIQHGVAFHHAGLASAHRKIVEMGFRQRIIKVISATPTLAAGVNLPGRRVIIRSLNRFSSGFGYSFIPVLEYKQMAGRAGRPRFDPYGEAVILAKQEEEVDGYLDRYIRAETEEIYSKLGYEPALRAHVLAFVAAKYVDSFKSTLEMIGITFYGYQNDGSMFLVEDEICKVFDILTEAKLISPKEPYQVTPFGKRVTELYLDPLSARMIKLGLETGKGKNKIPMIAYLQLLVNTPDIRNYSVRKKDMPKLFEIAEIYDTDWLNSDDEYSEFETDLFLASLKVAYVINCWLEEMTEEEIYVELGVSSGDLHSLLQRTEWLVHCGAEISKIFKWKIHRKNLLNIQKRIKYGVKKELLVLVGIRGIGRIRARTLFEAGFNTIEIIKSTPTTEIAKLPGFGNIIAQNIKNNISGKKIVYMDEGIIETDEDSREQTSLSTFFE